MGMLYEYDDVEKEIINDAAAKLANDIDREVLWSMLKEIGWTRVMLTRHVDNTHAIDITNWIEQNIHHPYERSGRDFIFEDTQDATMFILRWS